MKTAHEQTAKKSSLWDQFSQRNRLLTDLKSVMGLLTWDQETMMPRRGARFRASQYARLATLYHKHLTDPAYGEMIDQLEGQPRNEWEIVGLREARREYDRAARVPAALVKEMARTTSLAYQKWVRARRDDDFGEFSPWLEKIVGLKREEAACLDIGSCLYDSLLDEYEPGMRVAFLEPLFAKIRPRLSDLVARIQESPRQPDPKILKGTFPGDRQEAFGRRVISAIGFDWKAGRLDTSPHPFCSGLTPHDVRITTRYAEDDLSVALFGIIHEAGHALYEQGLDPDRFGDPAGQTVSLGIHESQSRLWEIFVGRSRPFWVYWYPLLAQEFPDQFKQVSLDEFLLAVNRVEPSLIRVDADEVTYGLHIILRFELEQALLEGTLEVAEIEEVWNEKMREYLGLSPPSAADGVLQDVHWSHGLIGYFPTYLLGTLYANQFYHRACTVLPGLKDEMRRGQYQSLRDWLRTNIHRVGRKYGALELVELLAGEPVNPLSFIGYLEDKYSELYAL